MADDPTPITLIIGMVQQLHADLKGNMTEIRTSLAGKADKVDIAKVTGDIEKLFKRLDGHEKRLEDIESAERARTEAKRVTTEITTHHRDRFRWWFGALIAAVSAVALVVSIVHP